MKKQRKLTMLAGAFVLSTVGATLVVPTASAESQVTLTWLMRSGAGENAWEKQVVKEFEAKNPAIKINLVIVPQAQIDQKTQTMIAGGNPPDVFVPDWGISGYGAYKSDLLNLSPFIRQDPSVLRGFSPNVIRAFRYHGEQISLPIDAMGSYLFYNKHLFDAAHIPYPTTNWNDKSWTWDKMVQIAKKLARNQGNPTREVFGVNDILFPDNGDSWMWGGDYFNKSAYLTGKMGTPNITSPGVVKGVEQHLKLVQEKIAPSPNMTSALSAIGDPFLSGRVGMEMTGGWGFANFAPAKFKWGVAALPWGSANRKDVLFITNVAIEKNTKYPKQAWQFIKFMVGTSSLEDLALGDGRVPGKAQVLKKWYALQSNKLDMPVSKLRQLLQGSFKYGSQSANQLIVGFSTIESTMDQSLNAIYNGQKSVHQGLSEMKQHLLALHLN